MSLLGQCQNDIFKYDACQQMTVYLGSQNRQYSHCMEELDKAICNVKKDYPNAIVMLGGDFNLGDISWDELAHIAGKAEKQHSDALLNIVGQHNLEQLVR